MNCVARFTKEDLKRRKSPNISIGSTEAEKQMHSTDLDVSIRSAEPPEGNDLKNIPETLHERLPETKKHLFLDNKVPPTTAYFFFTRNKSRCSSPNSPMKRSRKSTNLVRYRNLMTEPTLKKPLSKCMLLGNYKYRVAKHSDPEKAANKAMACDSIQKESNEVQVTIIENKSLQDAMTIADYDIITERLMVSIFQNPKNLPNDEIKLYIKQVIEDLYDAKFMDAHPAKALFRCLLEYWLKNTSNEPIKAAMTQSRSVDRQSNKFFTKDENLSSLYISNASKETQFHGLSELLVQYKKKPTSPPRPTTTAHKSEKRCVPKTHSPRRDTESFEKERKIQELEKLLKNTVYICETTRSTHSKEKDIKITKTLIDNLGKLSPRSPRSGINRQSEQPKNDTSNSSTEKIQDTINHLISDTSIPPDVAKEFLSAYLDVLLNDSCKSLTETSSKSSEHSAHAKADLSCEVQTEAVIKRVSRSVTTLRTESKEAKLNDMRNVDPGQLYLKDILDKITTIFSRVRKVDDKSSSWKNEKSSDDTKSSHFKHEEQKDELGRTVKGYPGKNLIYENYDENSVVIDLSRYDLEHISMFSDPSIKGIMSITIKLKEKPLNIGESKRTQLSLKFADSKQIAAENRKDSRRENWLNFMQPVSTNSNDLFRKKTASPPHPFIDFPKEFDLKPYLSSSDATSKAYRVTHESEHSLGLSFKSSTSLRGDSNSRQSCDNDGSHSCYVMSFKKESFAKKLQSLKKVRLKECNGVLLSPHQISPTRSPTRQPELSIFEKPTPRVIDEKFILLLLENLSLLSKNIPSLHKDINNLFLKLRKKHDKVIKCCSNIRGLSLLGKIYNEDACRSINNKDAMTQWDLVPYNAYDRHRDLRIKDKAINTSKVVQELVDAKISAIDFRLIIDNEVQTVWKSEEKVPKVHNDQQAVDNTSLVSTLMQTESATSVPVAELETTEQATSNPNWYQRFCTRDCSMSTMIKCVLDSNTESFRLQPRQSSVTPTPLRDKSKSESKKKKQYKLRQDLIKEIALLSPSFKVSTQSQTDRKGPRSARDRAGIDKDFKVYNLYQSKKFSSTRSSSMTDSNVEVIPSDEMKTLYRCSSDPSYCSG